MIKMKKANIKNRIAEAFSGENAFTITEVVFVSVISILVLTAVISAWSFSHKAWTIEKDRTMVRISLMKAVETIKEDTRLSSITSGSMLFFPEIEGVYTSCSILVAEPDENGLFSLDVITQKIDWDKTVIYHVYDDGAGSKTLRRTVYDGVLATETERMDQLKSVISAGEGSGSGYTTNKKFLQDVDKFEISPLSAVVDFYADSDDEVKADNVVFGWITLDDGDHTIRFENVAKNPDSSGDTIAIDAIKLDPSGGEREAEVYTPVISGGAVSKPYGVVFDNNQYLEFISGGAGEYMEITDGYDLWRESSFNDVALSKVEMDEFPLRARLIVPQDEHEGEYSWSAVDEVSNDSADGEVLGDSSSGSGLAPPLVLRTVLKAETIEWTRPLVRISLQSSSGSDLTVDKAFITRRSGTSGPLGLTNSDPSAVTDPDWADYHMHQQLFFKNDSGDVVESITIPAGEKKWSLWTAYPLDETKDYFISLYISSPASFECTFWPGIAGTTRTYYLLSSGWVNCAVNPALDTLTAAGHGLSDGDLVAVDGTTVPGGLVSRPSLPTLAGRPDWLLYYVVGVSGDDFQVSATDGGPVIDLLTAGSDVKFMKLGESDNIYITAEVDTWQDTGTVTSRVFDTTITDPAYKKVKWSEGGGPNTYVDVKVRSSDNNDMLGAADWSVIGAYTTSGADLSIGTGRYVQFQAELVTEPVWKTDTASMDYSDYLQTQSGGDPAVFPKDGAAHPYVTGVYTTWVDDVEIDWEGEKRICAIKGNIIKKNSFGRAAVTVDGKPLLKTLSVDVSVVKDTGQKTIEEKVSVNIEPLNTGK